MKFTNIELLALEMNAKKILLPVFEKIELIQKIHQLTPEIDLYMPRSFFELSLDLLNDYQAMINSGLSVGAAVAKLTEQHNFRAFVALAEEMQNQRGK